MNEDEPDYFSNFAQDHDKRLGYGEHKKAKRRTWTLTFALGLCLLLPVILHLSGCFRSDGPRQSGHAQLR